ncbi:MAG: GGDEF domain-containing protein [Thiovulaceae bacterium]|nr:GGDEF domain-containing protein [Sulfurimonadaceae bacterium]
MSKKDKILKIISNETIDAAHSMSIITPSIYATLFEENAKQHNIDLSDEIKLSQELLSKECKSLLEIREKNNQNVIQLSTSTSKAIDAIKQKDEDSLSEVLKETEKLRREVELLKETMYKDELTNVYNRKWLSDNFLEKNNKFKTYGILAIIDLNFFKEINDTYGHPVGDKVLIFIANNLKKTIGEVVRYGGDEFLIIFDKAISISDVSSTIDLINKNIISKKLKAKNGEFRVSFSIGISLFKKGDDFSDILEIADKKMYTHKNEIKKTITGIQ